MPGPQPGEAIVDYLLQCHARMEALVSTDAMRNGIGRFGTALATAVPGVARANQPFPVLDALTALDDSKLAQAFGPIARSLPWEPSRRTTDGGTETVVCALGEQLALDGVEVGFTLLDAHRFYPEHHHPPEELYLTISGTADWRFGGATEAVPLGPETLLYNHPHDVHSMLAGPDPLLAIWVLWDETGPISV